MPEVPGGLSPIGRALLPTDRILTEKNRATVAEIATAIAAELGGRTGAARLKIAYGDAPTVLTDAAGDVTVDVEDYDEEEDAPVVQVSQPAAGVARLVLLTVGFETPASMSLVLSFLGENVFVVDSEDASYVVEKRGTYLVAGRSFAIGEDLTTGWQVISIGGPSAEEFDEFREDIERGYGGGAAFETGAPFVSPATMTIDIRTANRTLALQAPEEIDDRSWLGRRMTLIVLCGPHMLTLQPGRDYIAIDVAGAAGSPGSPAFAPTLTQGVQRFDVVGGLSADGSTPTWFVTPGASIFDVVSGVLPVVGSLSSGGTVDISRQVIHAAAGTYAVSLGAPGDITVPGRLRIVYPGTAGQAMTIQRAGGTINGAAADIVIAGSDAGPRMIDVVWQPGGVWSIVPIANSEEVTPSTDPDLIWEWNGVDTSQFTASGDATWMTSADSLGPGGARRLVWTATVASGNKDRFLIINETLPNEYTLEVFAGPYSGNNNVAQRVQVTAIGAWEDATHWVGFAPQGDNVGGSNARNMERVLANGGSPAYTSVGTSVFAGGAANIGRYLVRVSRVSGVRTVSAATVMGGRTALVDASFAPTISGKAGIKIGHFGQSQAIGDTGFIYGLRIWRGHRG